MTLNQLLYVVEVSKTKSINATAHALYVSQSCVSTTIRELEGELGIIIFNRTNRGISTTKLGKEQQKQHFSVVMHHSTFATKAFASVVKEFGLEDYEYSIMEIELSEFEEYPCLIFEQGEIVVFIFMKRLSVVMNIKI